MAVSLSRAVPHSSGEHKSVSEPQLNKAGKSSALGSKGNTPMPLLMPWTMPWMPWMPMFGAQPCGMMPGMPMSMPMPMAPPMLGGRKAAAAATAKPSAAPGSCSAQGTATPAVPAAGLMVAEPTAAADSAAADEAADDEVPLIPDDEVTVEPEELEVFEKVAAMEREKEQKQQQQASQQFERASSPSGSCFTTMTGGSGSAPCSPVSAMQHPMPFPPGMPCFPFAPGFPCMPMVPPMPGFPQPAHTLPQQQQQPQATGMALQQQQQQHSQHHWQKQAQQLWKPQPASQVAGAGNSQAEVAPVPWNTFAADDCGDDLDKDLQELIMLPPADCIQQPEPCAAADAAAAAAAPAATGPAAAAKARSSSLRRIGSTASTHSTVDMLNATALGQANSSGSGSKTKRVLRIRNAKGSSGAVGGNSTGSGGSTGTGGSRIVLKGSTARRNITQQQQVVSAALGPIKAGVQKKTTASASKGCGSSSSPNKLSPSTVTGSPAKGGSMLGAAAVLGSKPLQEQQQCVLAAAAMQVDEEPSLSLLGDLDSCLSGGDAMTAGVMPGDDYWEGFMQEASDDGWDSLLGSNDLDFVVAGL